MALRICGYDFDGPFDIQATIVPLNRAAVYVVVTQDPNGQCFVENVGISGESCWDRNRDSGTIFLRYMPSVEGYSFEDRRILATKIRNQYNLG